MLEFARWKYILIVVVGLLGLVIAAPNFFGEDLAVQVARRDRANIDEPTREAIEGALREQGVTVKSSFIDGGRAMLLFDTVGAQLAARDAVNANMSQSYVSALARAPRAP